MKDSMLTVLSLGAGVQSSTLALMAAHGELPTPDVAIFADTQSEPGSVYEWLEFLKTKLPFPVVTVTSGSLRDEILRSAAGEARNDGRPPFYIRNPDGSRGILRRQCTQDYKVQPIQRAVRGLIGLSKGQRGPKHVAAEQWIGISLDERQRMKESGKPYIRNRWPLIERRMTRTDCVEWLNAHGYATPPKSACTFCPYRRDVEWRSMKERDPASFADACNIDAALRSGAYVLVGEAYLHDSLTPLAEVDLSTAEERGQVDWINGIVNECEGMCGV